LLISITKLKVTSRCFSSHGTLKKQVRYRIPGGRRLTLAYSHRSRDILKIDEKIISRLLAN
jgi:hypothetical protein